MNRPLVLPVLLVPVLLVPALTGCGGDGDAQARLDEKRVADSREALAAAQQELVARVDTFCRSSTSYVVALDRYGDLITQTAPTVADVEEAGADLAAPQSDVAEAAEQIASGREEVAEAERELAALTSAPPPSPSAVPSLPATTVDRVKQAEADFAAAREGITGQTPLRQASERFNAAAVALEMAWIGLLSEAGCLTADQQSRVRDYTMAIQTSLAEAGHYDEEVDGVYGPATVAAVEALQKAHDLPQTGTVDKATDAALREENATSSPTTAAVQQTLKLAGFWPAPVDGVWTDELTAALKEFQTALDVEPTGTVDAATIAAVENRTAPSPSAGPSG
ncbi:peptidoglycan-binding domain-containing protein [Actinoplanes sp. NPDC023714]|uniref:peptidoglycan-binding domain-containing protein n=1 Tax=Actinoplanes sp. NPDC023714 TaxID=3154322 RepID=UPI0033D1EE2F